MKTLLLLLMILAPISPDHYLLRDMPTIIVNKQTNQLAIVQEGKIQHIYKVATGKTNDLTPEGTFTVVVKAKNPYYRKKNIPGGSPKNPLGTRWIGFNALGTDGRIYGVHGTNNPASIGSHISNGCIRMNNKDVEKLYDQIPIGTKIKIVKSTKPFLQLIE